MRRVVRQTKNYQNKRLDPLSIRTIPDVAYKQGPRYATVLLCQEHRMNVLTPDILSKVQKGLGVSKLIDFVIAS